MGEAEIQKHPAPGSVMKLANYQKKGEIISRKDPQFEVGWFREIDLNI